ncbi:MAG: hypothetical protein JXA82_09390 [Sedimentisphaerales bacterium]|nr:hypothetical protein [Sedimentisphaerales bacterium]
MRKTLILFGIAIVCSPAWALIAGFNVDVHMDIPPEVIDLPANDFHIEGRVESSSPPELVQVISDFPMYSDPTTVFEPDPADPDGRWYIFRIDFWGAEFKYCDWLHLGLFFDLECSNLVIDLVGWWTRDGVPIRGGLNDGTVLIPGFEVEDIPLERPQFFRVRNDSHMQTPARITELQLTKFTAEQVDQMGGMQELAAMLRREGQQEGFKWIGVEDPQGILVSPNNPQEFPPDSFFDVFVEVELPDQGFHTTEAMPIDPGDVLISRVGVENENNAGEPEFRWIWHMHEGHHADLGDAPDTSNSWGIAPMTAYPPGGPLQVLANFPTVYQMGSPPHGPIHWRPRDLAWLGPQVSMEMEADIGPDQDGVNNIIPPQDQPDLDQFDDGVLFPLNLQWCQSNRFQYIVTVNNPILRLMYVNVWFDWNMDGDWDDTLTCPDGTSVPEWAVQNDLVQIPGAGTYTLTTSSFPATWPLGPVDLPIDHMWMRITLAEQPWQVTAGAAGFGGSGPPRGYRYGETEDYLIDAPPGPDMDFGDAPEDPTGLPPSYPTTLASNGARHLFSPNIVLGASVDPEPNGQPTANADGDDNDGNDDEDGVTFDTPLIAGANAQVTVIASVQGLLQCWIDYNADGDWADAGEQVMTDVPVTSGANILPFTVPAGAVAGPTYARFRFSTAAGLSYDGAGPFGEVEDYLVEIEEIPDRDWGDAPDGLTAAGGYPTLKINSGASHLIDSNIFLGVGIDPERDGQPNATATGDDNDGNDDEDGVVFNTWPLVPGRPAKIEVTASVAGSLFAWIDFNADGSWAEVGDQIFSGQLLGAGSNVLVFNVPMTAKPNCTTFARFRFIRDPDINLGFAGDAANGEVEDYRVKIGNNCGIKWVQRPDLTPGGIDIRVDNSDGRLRWMADDFLCTETGHITDVHLWGSKFKDKILDEPPVIEKIHLSIHSDDPVGEEGPDPDNTYSKPAKLLWEGDFLPGEFDMKLAAKVEGGEYWWDIVNEELIPGGDTEVWRIDIQIPPEKEPFLQEGSREKPIVYWLDVQVDVPEGYTFGWKTRRWPEHFNDDAVFDMGSELPRLWKELRYPPTHPYHGVMFEDLTLGTYYHVGDMFVSAGVPILVQSFEFSNGTWTSQGYTQVGNGLLAGGSGQEMIVNNVNLEFQFPEVLPGLQLLFGEYGGNCNININGDHRNFANFQDIDGQVIGGVQVSVTGGAGNETGILRLYGDIHQFYIGGQEFAIDNVGSNSIDMAFAITSEAFCCRSADLNCDGKVDLEDLAIFAAQWLQQVP